MEPLEQALARMQREVLAALQAVPDLQRTVEAFEDLRAEAVFADRGVLTARVTAPAPSPSDPADSLARVIDHTLLKPEATAQQIARVCAEAAEYHFASVCVNPWYVRLAADLLAAADDVAVCTVVGFPLGATTPQVKVFETLQAVADGATEIDMVLNIGALKSKRYDAVARDIRGVVVAAHNAGALVKVIIEAALLSREEKIAACLLAKAAEADFVKTSTGFGPGGATVEDVALMRAVVGEAMGVKAAGGIRTYAQARAMLAAGANRLGASAGVKIVAEARGEGGTAEDTESGE